MPPIASLSSQEPLMTIQTLDTGGKLWPWLISALSTILLCLFGLHGVWMFQGQRARRPNRRGSDVELGTTPTAGIRIVRKAPAVVSRPAPAPVRPRADSQPPTTARGAITRRFRIPGWPPRSRVEAQAFLRRRVGPHRFPPDAVPAGDGGSEPSGGTAVGVRQRRRRRLAVSSSRE